MTEGPVDELSAPPEAPARNQVARLQHDLRRAEARAERAERALDRAERSASYVVGNLLVNAAKSPKRLLTLPRDLWRIWRLRRSRRSTPPSSTGPRGRRDDILDLDAPRLLIPRTSVAAAAQGSLAIAGALSHRTMLAWQPYAAVSSALPHEGPALVEAVDADIVVIDTAAALPGETWEYLGNPAAVDRLRAASALVDAAHAQGRPVVLLRSTSPTHTVFFTELAQRCDLVVDGPGSTRDNPWHPGIDPAAWQFGEVPRDAGAFVDWQGPAGTPLERDIRAAALAELGDRAVRSPDPRLHRSLAMRNAVSATTYGLGDPMWVTGATLGAAPVTLGLLASGRRIVTGHDADLSALLRTEGDARGAALFTEGTEGLAEAIDQAGRPMSDPQRRAVLRAIMLGASAPVQLSVLADRLDIEARPRSVWDVALVVGDDPDIDQILLQTWRPREIVTRMPLTDRANALLRDEGIDTTPLPDEVLRDRTLLSMAVTTPYIARQVDLEDPHGILDLLVERLADLPTLPRQNDSALWRTT